MNYKDSPLVLVQISYTQYINLSTIFWKETMMSYDLATMLKLVCILRTKKLLHQKRLLQRKNVMFLWSLVLVQNVLHHFASHFYSLSFLKNSINRILIEFLVCLPTNHLPLKHHFLLHPTYLILLDSFYFIYNDLFFPRLGFSSHVLFISMSIASRHP